MQKASNGEAPNDLMIDGTTVNQLRRKLFRIQASKSRPQRLVYMKSAI